MRAARSCANKTMYLYQRSTVTSEIVTLTSTQDSEITQVISNLTDDKEINFKTYLIRLKERLNQTVVRDTVSNDFLMVEHEQDYHHDISDIEPLFGISNSFQIMGPEGYKEYLKQSGEVFFKLFTTKNKQHTEIVFLYMSIILSHMLCDNFRHLSNDKKYEDLLKKHKQCFLETKNYTVSRVLGEISDDSERFFVIKKIFESNKRISDNKEKTELLKTINIETTNKFNFLNVVKKKWTAEQEILFDDHMQKYERVKLNLQSFFKAWNNLSNELFRKGFRYLFGSFLIPAIENNTCSEDELNLYNRFFSLDKNKTVTYQIDNELKKLEQGQYNLLVEEFKKVDLLKNLENHVKPKRNLKRCRDDNFLDSAVKRNENDESTENREGGIKNIEYPSDNHQKDIEVDNVLMKTLFARSIANDIAASHKVFTKVINNPLVEEKYYDEIFNYLTNAKRSEEQLNCDIDDYLRVHYPLWNSRNLLKDKLDERLITRFKIDITYRSLNGLMHDNWLRDDIICCMVEVINLMFYCINNVDEKPTVHCWNTFLFSKLFKNDVYEYNFVKNWTKRMDTFDFKKMFFPINISNNHWTLVYCEINSDKKIIEISYYDSFGPQRSSQKYCLGIKMWFESEFQKRNMRNKYSYILLDKSIKQQFDGFNCGVIVIQNMIHLAFNREIRVYKDIQELSRLRSLIAFICTDKSMHTLPFVSNNNLNLEIVESDMMKHRSGSSTSLKSIEGQTPVDIERISIIDHQEVSCRYSDKYVSATEYLKFLQIIRRKIGI